MLTIDDNVSLFGTSTTSALVSYSDIEIGVDVYFSGLNGVRWGGLAVQNPDLDLNRVSFTDCIAILNTIPNLNITDCDFTRAGLIGQFLYGDTRIDNNTFFTNSYATLNGSHTGKILIDDCHFDGPNYDNSQFGLRLTEFSDYSIGNSIIQDYPYGIYLLYCSGPRNKRDISNNSIHDNYWAGIFINKSYANIFNNPGIYENGVGILV